MKSRIAGAAKHHSTWVTRQVPRGGHCWCHQIDPTLPSPAASMTATSHHPGLGWPSLQASPSLSLALALSISPFLFGFYRFFFSSSFPFPLSVLLLPAFITVFLS